MSKSAEGKHVRFEIQTTQGFLDGRGLSIADIEKATRTLARIFGRKYERMFPLKIKSNDIDRIIYIANVLGTVEDFIGFKRHVRQYSKRSIDHHLFTAKTAAWLASLGKTVEFEPSTSEGIRDPDLKCDSEGQQAVYIECKRIMTEKFFGLEEKQKLAKLIYEKLPTCDQLNFYLLHEGSVKKVSKLVSDKSFATVIFGMGMKNEESTVDVEGEFHVTVIQKPPIIGGEDDFLTATLGGWLQDVESGVRLPGYAFMRGGRCIAIHGPPPSYRKIWDKKRHTSKHQSVPNHPFVAIVSDDDVLGDPLEHGRFFSDVWLTENNTEFSGIGFLSFARMPGEPENPRFSFSSNPHAKHPLAEEYFTTADTAPS